jgi:hypothetical protein
MYYYSCYSLVSKADLSSIASSDDDGRSIFGHANASNYRLNREEADLDYEAAEKANGEAEVKAGTRAAIGESVDLENDEYSPSCDSRSYYLQ